MVTSTRISKKGTHRGKTSSKTILTELKDYIKNQYILKAIVNKVASMYNCTI